VHGISQAAGFGVLRSEVGGEPWAGSRTRGISTYGTGNLKPGMLPGAIRLGMEYPNDNETPSHVEERGRNL
jgi:hypothetical protein